MAVKPYFNFKSIKISKNVIKLTISKNFINKNNLKIKNPLDIHTQQKLQKLINLNHKTKNLNLDKNTAAEIIKTSNSKFNIFFDKSRKQIKKINKTANTINSEVAIIAKFTKLKNLKFFCKNIFQTYNSFWFISKLYKFKELSLILIIYTKKETENELLSLLTEFNAITEKGKLQEAVTKEYCNLIFSKNAIEKIALID